MGVILATHSLFRAVEPPIATKPFGTELIMTPFPSHPGLPPRRMAAICRGILP